MKKSNLFPLILMIIILGLLVAIVVKGAIKNNDNSNDNVILQNTKIGEDNGENKVYRFTLADNGYFYEQSFGSGENLSGIKNNYLKKSYISKSKSVTKIGFLRIVNNYVPQTIQFEDFLNAPLVIDRNKDILIYHVHALEGYCATEEDKTNLSLNEIPGNQNNVVYIGDVIKNSIESKTSIDVIRNATVFDRTGGSDATYLSAIPMLKQALTEHSDIGLIIDIHRNAIDVSKEKYGPVITYNNVNYAPISFVLGMDWSYEGEKNDSVNPYWRENLKLTMLVAKMLEDRVPGIVDNIGLRKNPYNQHLVANSLLIEIGFDGNLTSEAEATAKLLAEVLGEIYG